ncbi:MAG: hypothetical protein ACRD5D_04765 [Candidatus Polarisedimenticolia bacterium]
MTKRALPRFASALLLAAALWLPATPALADGDFNFFLGQKSLDEDDWAPAEEHGELGIEMSWGDRRSPIRVATDILLSSGSEEDPFVEFDVSTYEIAVGVRGVWKSGNARPFFGGGLAIVGATAEFSNFMGSVDDDGQGIGIWVGGGVFWRAGRSFNVGFSGRISAAEVEVFGVDTEAGGFHFGLLLGWGS